MKPTYKITYDRYFDKVYGGWFGKCLGGAAGAPVEGKKELITISDFREIINPHLPNDDLDIQLLWLETLEKNGVDLTLEKLADAWMEKCWYPFSEYGYFMKNYKRGIRPPYSGTFNNSFFKEGMGSPIRSEIWGFVFPCQPDIAVKYAKMDSELDHADNSVWAEMFLAAVESQVFCESDLHALLDIGLSYIPKDCKVASCIRMVMREYNRNNHDWQSVREKVLHNYGHHDFTNVTQNMGFITIALLYGNKNMSQTINIAVQCGYDTDCTAATAGAIVGALQGYKALDNRLKALVSDSFVCGINVKRRSNSIKDLSEDTCRIGISVQSACLDIVEIPKDVSPYVWQYEKKKVKIEIKYLDQPAIGAQDEVAFEIVVYNNSPQALCGIIAIKDIPEGWALECNDVKVYVKPSSHISIINKAYTTNTVTVIKNTNLLEVHLLNFDGYLIEKTVFGIVGASIWKPYGPFFMQMDKKSNPRHPSPHSEGCVLPTVECMVNNEVFLEKEYIDENKLDFSGILSYKIINAYEDIIPVDKAYTMEGQCCFYLVQDVLSPTETEAWVVIGNNDGFKLWLNNELVLAKDEIRLWTPYNNCEIIKLNQGINRFVLKLLRRTKNIELSFGIRKYEGEHWHRKQWITDLGSII